jgi:NADPH:quinone reductase
VVAVVTLKSASRAAIDLYAQGRIRPRISERFPLQRAAEAIARLCAREAVGKLVVSIASA